MCVCFEHSMALLLPCMNPTVLLYRPSVEYTHSRVSLLCMMAVHVMYVHTAHTQQQQCQHPADRKTSPHHASKLHLPVVCVVRNPLEHTKQTLEVPGRSHVWRIAGIHPIPGGDHFRPRLDTFKMPRLFFFVLDCTHTRGFCVCVPRAFDGSSSCYRTYT